MRKCDIFVVKGSEVLVNHTFFVDEVYGTENGKPDNASKPYKSVDQLPLFDNIEPGAVYGINLAPGTYTIPSNVNAVLHIRGANRFQTKINFAGFDSRFEGYIVSLQDVQILADPSPMTIRGRAYFQDCFVYRPIYIDNTELRVEFQNCFISIDVKQDEACIQTPLNIIPADLNFINLVFRNCTFELLTGTVLIQGAISFNCIFHDLRIKDSSAVVGRKSIVRRMIENGVGSITFNDLLDGGLIFTAFLGCEIENIYGGHNNICFVTCQDTHFHYVKIEGAQGDLPSGEFAVGSFFGNTTFDLIETGDGDQGGDSGSIFVTSTLTQCFFSGLSTGKGGDAPGSNSPGNAGIVFYECFDLINIFILYYIQTSGAGTNDNGEHGVGGRVVWNSQIVIAVNNFIIEESLSVGEYGQLFYIEGQVANLDSIHASDVYMLGEGSIIEVIGSSAGAGVSVVNLTFTNAYFFVDTDATLIHASIEIDNLSQSGKVFQVISVSGVNVEQIATFPPVDSTDSGMAVVRLIKIDKLGNGTGTALATLSSVTVNGITASGVSALSVDTPDSSLQANSINLRNIATSDLNFASASNGGKINLSMGLLESANVNPEFAARQIEHQYTKMLLKQKRLEDKLLKLGYYTMFDIQRKSIRLAAIGDGLLHAFEALAGGEVDLRSVKLSTIDCNFATITRVSSTLSHRDKIRGKLGVPLPGRLRAGALSAEAINAISNETVAQGQMGLFESQEEGELYLTEATLENVIVNSPDQTHLFYSTQNAILQTNFANVRNLDLTQTPSGSRILKSESGANSVSNHISIQSIQMPDTQQIETAGGTIDIRFVYVESGETSGVGTPTIKEFVSWDGIS